MGGAVVALPNISICEEEYDLHVNDSDYYKRQYLTFVALADGTFKFSGSTSANTLSYSLDKGETWVALEHDTDTPTVNSGNSIMWKGNDLSALSGSGIGVFISSENFNVEGNIMSLLFGDNFEGQTSLAGKNFTFYCLFSGNTNVINAQNLVLPATILANNCYRQMFRMCTNLVTAPALPATTLASVCYYMMFMDCTSLTSAPELPAKTLGSYCYSYMFANCRSLTSAPELPAIILTYYCYRAMFMNCTSLTTAPELPATTLANYCYYMMFMNCTSLTGVPSNYLPATNLSLAPHERLPEILVVPREKTPTGAAARGNP